MQKKLSIPELKNQINTCPIKPHNLYADKKTKQIYVIQSVNVAAGLLKEQRYIVNYANAINGSVGFSKIIEEFQQDFVLLSVTNQTQLDLVFEALKEDAE